MLSFFTHQSVTVIDVWFLQVMLCVATGVLGLVVVVSTTVVFFLGGVGKVGVGGGLGQRIWVHQIRLNAKRENKSSGLKP